MSKLLKEKEIKVMDLDDNEITFFISRFPIMDGLQIVKNLMPSAKDLWGADNGVALQEVLHILRFVDVVKDGERIRLETESIIQNSLPPDAELVFKVAFLAYEYNTNFFKTENLYRTLNKIRGFLGLSNTKISTLLSDLLSQTIKLVGKDSKK